MFQELFRIPGLNIPVYGYGLMLVIGFLAGIELAKFLARRCGINPEVLVNAGLIALVAGVIGSRLSHVLENIHDFTRPELGVWGNLLNMVNIRSGGLTFYGGFLLATPACIAYGIYKKAPIPLGMDIIAPCLMIGLGFGRIGCFLNGCCYGAECDLPWAVHFPYHSNAYLDEFNDGALKQPPPPELLTGNPSNGMLELKSGQEVARSQELRMLATQQHSNAVHPAQLYSAFNAFLIAALLVAYFTLPHVPGRVFALMLIVESVTRFILELLRVEPPVLGPMSFSMVLSIFLFAAGIILWFAFGWLGRGKVTGFAAAAPAQA